MNNKKNTMNKIILLLILTSTTLFAEVNTFDSMDEETAVNTGIYKLSAEEKLALLKWIEGSTQQAKEQLEKQVRQEVSEQVEKEVRQEVTEQIKKEVTQEVAKTERRKFMGFSMRESDREIITSTAVGEVKGWTGKSIITLENGQVWKQAGYTVTRFAKKTNPKITIKPKSFNSWILYIDGLNRGIKVKRIK